VQPNNFCRDPLNYLNQFIPPPFPALLPGFPSTRFCGIFRPMLPPQVWLSGCHPRDSHGIRQPLVSFWILIVVGPGVQISAPHPHELSSFCVWDLIPHTCTSALPRNGTLSGERVTTVVWTVGSFTPHWQKSCLSVRISGSERPRSDGKGALRRRSIWPIGSRGGWWRRAETRRELGVPMSDRRVPFCGKEAFKRWQVRRKGG
jgi:hypothetical protein